MSNRNKRPKANDIFQQSNYVFGQKVEFEEAFPQIDDITVKVRESGAGVYGSYERTLGKTSIGQYVNCSNPICHNGGFSLANILYSMVRERKTEHESTEICQGYEGSPKGKRVYRKCINTFRVYVSIKYKEEPG
jgi:hypothetical protein